MEELTQVARRLRSRTVMIMSRPCNELSYICLSLAQALGATYLDMRRGKVVSLASARYAGKPIVLLVDPIDERLEAAIHALDAAGHELALAVYVTRSHVTINEVGLSIIQVLIDNGLIKQVYKTEKYLEEYEEYYEMARQLWSEIHRFLTTSVSA